MMATWRILEGDTRDVLKTLPAESVHCVITSPPYMGLRDYGTGTWEGGDPACDHRASGSGTKVFGNPAFNENRPSREMTKTADYQYRATCGKCGATRVDKQIGLEPTPADYVQALVDVFREVRRVLRPEGVAWLNLGDSYAGAGYSNHANTGGAQREQGGKQKHFVVKDARYQLRPDLTPEQVAYVLGELAKARSIASSTDEGQE